MLVALPLGAVLCFFNLLGARAFSRGELALQTKFHAPLAHPAPYPPRTLFTRYREPTVDEIESRRVQLSRGGLIREKSFYRNTYAMVSFCIPKTHIILIRWYTSLRTRHHIKRFSTSWSSSLLSHYSSPSELSLLPCRSLFWYCQLPQCCALYAKWGFGRQMLL